jgi:hypothetical protein
LVAVFDSRTSRSSPARFELLDSASQDAYFDVLPLGDILQVSPQKHLLKRQVLHRLVNPAEVRFDGLQILVLDVQSRGELRS